MQIHGKTTQFQPKTRGFIPNREIGSPGGIKPDRLLDANNPSVTLVTLTKAAAAIGKRINITFEDDERVPKAV